MIIKIFSVRDNAVEAFLQPFFSPTSAAALRSLKEAVNDPKHDFHKHSADYALWDLGQFDDSTGMLAYSPGGPVRLISCIDLLGLD